MSDDQIFGPHKLNRADYQKYIVKQRGGKDYLMVVGALKAAMESGIIVGSETSIEDTDKVVRVKVRLKALNKHIPEYAELPPDLRFGYYEGVADNPKVGGQGAAEKFPLEDAETSALGRALAKLGFVVDNMASADEMALVEKKQSSGYEVNRPTREKMAELYSALKSSGVATDRAAANMQAVEIYGVNLTALSAEQVDEWLKRLSVPF